MRGRETTEAEEARKRRRMIALAHAVTAHPVKARQDDARRMLANADGGRGERKRRRKRTGGNDVNERREEHEAVAGGGEGGRDGERRLKR